MISGSNFLRFSPFSVMSLPLLLSPGYFSFGLLSYPSVGYSFIGSLLRQIYRPPPPLPLQSPPPGLFLTNRLTLVEAPEALSRSAARLFFLSWLLFTTLPTVCADYTSLGGCRPKWPLPPSGEPPMAAIISCFWQVFFLGKTVSL